LVTLSVQFISHAITLTNVRRKAVKPAASRAPASVLAKGAVWSPRRTSAR
jgi:hypothetical protein